MIQEESTQRTVALMIRTTRLTESVLKKAMIMYCKCQAKFWQLRFGGGLLFDYRDLTETNESSCSFP